jgi:hypothetical protein
MHVFKQDALISHSHTEITHPGDPLTKRYWIDSECSEGFLTSLTLRLEWHLSYNMMEWSGAFWNKFLFYCVIPFKMRRFIPIIQSIMCHPEWSHSWVYEGMVKWGIPHSMYNSRDSIRFFTHTHTEILTPALSASKEGDILPVKIIVSDTRNGKSQWSIP